jgi:hypothetical protein
MRTTCIRTVLAGALALAALSSSAAAQAWTGAGTSGVDPLGQGWRLDDSLGPLAWSIPGLGDGGRPWDGPVPLTSFTIAFVGGSPISANFDEFDFFATRLYNSDRDVTWRVLLSTDRHTAHFVAPAGDGIAPGELFLANVIFDGAERPESFSARYGVSAVPEPGTYALLATGLAVLGVGARRQRRPRSRRIPTDARDPSTFRRPCAHPASLPPRSSPSPLPR